MGGHSRRSLPKTSCSRAGSEAHHRSAAGAEHPLRHGRTAPGRHSQSRRKSPAVFLRAQGATRRCLGRAVRFASGESSVECAHSVSRSSLAEEREQTVHERGPVRRPSSRRNSMRSACARNILAPRCRCRRNRRSIDPAARRIDRSPVPGAPAQRGVFERMHFAFQHVAVGTVAPLLFPFLSDCCGRQSARTLRSTRRTQT